MISCPKTKTWHSVQPHKIWHSAIPEILKGCKILKLVTWPWPRPFQGQFVMGRLGHAMVNLPTKFEVSTFSRYVDMKCVKNPQNGGWFGVVRGHPRSSKMSPFDRAHTTSYSTLIETMRLSCTVFELQLVICRNSLTLPYPTCIWRPRWGWPRSNFKKNFGVRKLESLGYRVALFASSYV